MTIDDRSRYDIQNIHFTIDTNRGQFHPHAFIQTISLDSTTPNSLVIHHRLKEPSNSVEFVHRHLLPSGETWAPILKAPPNFKIAQLNTQAGTVAGHSGYEFIDTRYLVELTDSAVGNFNDQITISSVEGRPVATIPVTWQRRPNLSTSPDRILLGPKSVRVFLASDDETIEFRDVSSVPEGVRAVITSPREITVSLAAPANKLINSHLEVRTTSDSDPLVRVPVIRYVGNMDAVRQSSD